MPRTGKFHHLVLNHNTWVIRYQIPADCRHLFDGKREYLRSTGFKESEIISAELARDVEIANIKVRINNFRRAVVQDIPAVESLTQKAKQDYTLLQKEIKILSTNPLNADNVDNIISGDETLSDLHDALINALVPGGYSAISAHASEIGTTDKSVALQSLHPTLSIAIDNQLQIAMNKGFDAEIDSYIKETDINNNGPKYKNQILNLIVASTKEFPLIKDVTVNSVKALIRKKQLEGTAPATIRRHLSIFSGYWSHLQDLQLANEDVNPFRNRKVRGKAKYKRKTFSIEEAILLVDGKTYQSKRYPYLIDFIKLGLLTGCRVNELCEIKIETIKAIENVRVIDITEAMTKGGTAGARRLPISRKMEVVIDRLIVDAKKNKTDYLFKGKRDRFGKRTRHMSTMFGAHKTQLGFEPHVQVAHSFRHSANMILSKAVHGVPLEHRNALFGWTPSGRQSMSVGAYGHIDESYTLPERHRDMEKLSDEYYFI
tara:strand:+ start:600 stop:2060 length:1461 start_codon:yes stop_codon:yes gene_type:complete